MHEVRETWPAWFYMQFPNEASFPLSNRCYDYCKNVFYPFSLQQLSGKHIPSSKSCKPITPNYNWENGVKQIKITEENLSESCILCQLLRTKALASGSKYIKHFFYFYHYLSYICWVDVFCLICPVFLKSPWWLVWIFCIPIPLT